MKHWGRICLICLAVMGCASEKKIAPTEGRLSLVEQAPLETTKESPKLDKAKEIPFNLISGSNAQNKAPHYFVKETKKNPVHKKPKKKEIPTKRKSVQKETPKNDIKTKINPSSKENKEEQIENKNESPKKEEEEEEIQFIPDHNTSSKKGGNNFNLRKNFPEIIEKNFNSPQNKDHKTGEIPSSFGIFKNKLEVLVNSNDGFYIANEDLKRRGPGELGGYRQSGLPSFNFVNIVSDFKIFTVARDDAKFILQNRLEPSFRKIIELAKKEINNDKFTNV